MQYASTRQHGAGKVYVTEVIWKAGASNTGERSPQVA